MELWDIVVQYCYSYNIQDLNDFEHLQYENTIAKCILHSLGWRLILFFYIKVHFLLLKETDET